MSGRISMSGNEIHPLKNYIVQLKREHTHCQHCNTALIRASAILDGQPLIKKKIETMTDLINQHDWVIFKSRIFVLCRFCCELHAQPKPLYFDLVSFQYYLRFHTPMKASATREYLVRLRRIDSYLTAVNFTLDEFSISAIEHQLTTIMTPLTLSNARSALQKYAAYLAWRSAE